MKSPAHFCTGRDSLYITNVIPAHGSDKVI